MGLDVNIRNNKAALQDLTGKRPERSAKLLARSRGMQQML